MKNTVAMLEKIITDSPGYIFWKDQSLVYRGCNKNFAKIIGYALPHDIIGKSDNDLHWENNTRKEYAKEDEYILSTGKTLINKEVRMKTNYSGLRILSVSKSPLYDMTGKNIIGILGIYSDITEMKKAEGALIEARECAEAANQAKSEFIQNMSHDLRTPLTGLLGISASQVVFLADDDPNKENYRLICDSARQLQRMFETILETAGIDYRDSAAQSTPFILDTVINNVIALLKPSMLHKHLDCTVKPLGTLPEKAIMGHPLMLERVLMNLLGNAIKFTDQGNITIQYGINQGNLSNKSDTQYVTLIIKDSGQGIPLDKQTEIFERFTRVSPSYQGLHGGHGLGLYITKKLITLMGGTIEAESKGEGQGATFICNIPVTLTDQPPTPLTITTQSRAETHYQQSIRQALRTMPSTPTTQQPVNDTTVRYRVLLVEDNEIAARVAAQYLERQQCDVTVANTAKKALSFAEYSHYDCIFMDVGLPDGDGRDITHTIRSTRTFANVHTPIIGLTAHADSDIQQACLAAGMNVVYCKPLNPERVNTVLNDMVVRPTHSNSSKKQNHVIQTDQDASVPILDLTIGTELLQCDEPAINELLDQFMTTLKNDNAQLVDIFNRCQPNKWKMLSDLAHRLRGACGYCGALRLQRSCEALEQQFYANADEITLINCYQAVIDDISALENVYQNR